MPLTPEQIAELRTKAGLSVTPPAIGASDIIAKRKLSLGIAPETTEVEIPKPEVPALDFIKGISEKFKERGQVLQKETQRIAEKVLVAAPEPGLRQVGASVLGGAELGAKGAFAVARSVGDIFAEGFKALASQETEEKVKQSIQNNIQEYLAREPGQRGLIGDQLVAAVPMLVDLAKKNPEATDNIVGLIDVLTLGGAKAVEKPLIKAGQEAIETGVEAGIKVGEKVVGAVGATKTSLFGRQAQSSVDDVIKQADEALKPAQILAKTEQATAKPSLLERWSGISADIKNRIAGKYQRLKEYFDVAHARNNFDTLPTPLEYGAKNVDNAASKMESVLNETGGEIGQFRRKIGTYEAGIDQVANVEKSFTDQLAKLNLEIKKGTVRQKAGTVTRVNSPNEIKVLNDLFSELQIVKENPNLEKLIDLRMLFDNKINFAKSAREVSNSLDPLSRTVRKQIADTSAGIVGKSEASRLAKYSQFIEAYNNLKSFTDRKAGAEFLLKQVLSERGGVPREVIQTIKEFTGIDLMDDAVMASIATDLIGNSRQKGLFRQELTKAGLDAAAAATGDMSGAINLMFKLSKSGFGKLLNVEKQFLKAAK